MSKKLLSLIFVLALAGMASAIQWEGPAYTDAPGAWEDTTNWSRLTTDDPYRIPVASDATVQIYRLDGAGANVTITSAVSGGIKPQMKFNYTKLDIKGTGSLSNSGSVEMSSTLVYADVTISGVWNACQKTLGTLATFKLSSATSGTAIVDVYGTLNVKNTGTLTTVGSELQIGAGTNTGAGRVIINAGGLVNVDLYSINGTVITGGTYDGQTRGKITIAAGGLMKIKGWVDTQVNTDIANGLIVCNDPHIRAWLVTEGATQYTYVPEPATIALLGLGSLMLLRKKR